MYIQTSREKLKQNVIYIYIYTHEERDGKGRQAFWLDNGNEQKIERHVRMAKHKNFDTLNYFMGREMHM